MRMAQNELTAAACAASYRTSMMPDSSECSAPHDEEFLRARTANYLTGAPISRLNADAA
jgi:hypothetical protein